MVQRLLVTLGKSMPQNVVIIFGYNQISGAWKIDSYQQKV
jgi:hypothetical protein